MLQIFRSLSMTPSRSLCSPAGRAGCWGSAEIFGFGGIGAATARLIHGIGMRVHAINQHGRTDERVDWIGTPERLNELLEAADVLLISVR